MNNPKKSNDLTIPNKDPVYQTNEKGKSAAGLIIPNEELLFQYKEKDKQNAELIIANKKLLFQQEEKEKQAAELTSVNKELTLQKNLLEKANNLARIGNWEFNLADNSIHWSEITRQIHEVDEHFIPDFQSGIHYFKEGTNRDYITRAVQEAIKHGVPWDLELLIVTAKNNERWVRAIGEPELVDGKCIRIFGSFQDIDGGKRAEMAATKILQEKNIILESISDAFFAVDQHWLVTYWNREAERILFRSRNEIIGNNLWDMFPDAIGSESYIYYHRAIEENAVQHFETFYKTLNKTYEVTAYPSPSGLSVYFRDITEKIFMQKQLLDGQKNKHEEITKAVVFAQEKERSEIGEELHDNVNQLLAASKLYLDHSLTNIGNKELIVKAQEYIISSMEEIRKLSHALVGPTKDKMMGLIESLNELFGNIQLVKNIRINFRHDTYDEGGTESGLKLVIYRIIQEQFNNILKHSGASEVNIVLEKDTDHLTIMINDNGQGFDPLKKGKGIGLKNIYNRASIYHGEVEIDSSPGNGCKLAIIFTTSKFTVMP